MSVLAAGGSSGGAHVLLAFAVVYAFFGFVLWAFGRHTDGMLWLLIAIVVGLLMGAGADHHSPAHLTDSTRQVTTH
jgi:hypothetical protein